MKLSRLLLAATILSVPVAASMAQEAAGPDASAPSAYTASPAATRAPLKSVTHHDGMFGGQAVAYDATVSEHYFRAGDGSPEAWVTTTAYVRSDVDNAAARPVMFLFNGGPGASSSPLHMGAFGPRGRDEEELVDNPDSILDTVDLVFIDPVGTGYSRVFDGVEGEKFWSRTGDAAAVATVIETWLAENGREASPRYLAGQSYGTTRAAMILKGQPALEFDGVLLFALVANVEGDALQLMTAIPTMATTAYHYGVIKTRGRTIDDVYAEAVKFARTDYIEALIQGGSISAAEKKRVAEKLSALTGVSKEVLLEKDLKLDATTFMFEVIKDRGLRTGLLDTRVTAERDLTKTGARDDPALPQGGFNAPRSDEPTAIERYFTQELGYQTTEGQYYGVNFEVNSAWDHEGFTNVNGAFGERMQADSDMRLFWVGGYFDLTTPAYAARFAIDQAGVPGDRVTSALFPGAHSVFYEEDNRAALADAVRKFVTE